MARIVKTVNVTILVEFDSEDEASSTVDMAIPNALDMFNEGNDYVTLSWEAEEEIERTEVDNGEVITVLETRTYEELFGA